MNEISHDTTSNIDLTASLVAAYLSHNNVRPADLPDLIDSVHSALSGLGAPAPEPEAAKPVPAVSIKKSITPDYLISLEDGKHYKSLKRHLAGRGLTPAEYRTKWGLASDYPMTAPAYSAKRSELARSLGLGRKREPEPVTAQEPVAAAESKRRGRAKKAA